MVTPPVKFPQAEADLSAETWLRSLDKIEGKDLPLVGGKAFRLGLLRRQGLNVPPGLVLTTTFFETHIRQTKLTPLWLGSPDVAVTTESLSWLADTLKITPLPKILTEALHRQLALEFGPDLDSLAVRSSAIDEDQRDHTFAGVHLTELGVPRAALPIAITRCWASAFSRPALDYRQAHGMSIQGIRVAILIQPMLKPTVSGVGFTSNPLTGNRDEIVIEATWGLGERLVSGQVQPYFYKLADHPPDYPLLERQPGRGTGAEGQEPLSGEELTPLAQQLKQIQALLGEPQDVEWARQDGRLYILQARPVALPPEPAPVLELEWTRGSHPEYLPELPSPLFSSLLERSQRQANRFFRDLGLNVEEVGPFVKFIVGRPYLNLTFLKRMISQVGIAPGKLLYTIGQVEPGSIGSPLSVDWETAFKARRIYWGVLKKFFSYRRELKQYQNLVAESVTRLAQTDFNAPAPQLLGLFRLHDRLYERHFYTNLSLGVALTAVTALGNRIIAPITHNPAVVITALAQRRVQTTEGALAQRLQALSHLAREEETTRRYFAIAPDDFADYEDSLAVSAAFRQAFAALLSDIGDRALYEADPGWPRYKEQPAALLRLIRQYLQVKAAPPAAGEPGQVLTWATLADQARGLDRRLPWRRWLVGPFIVALSRLLLRRDELNAGRAQAMAALRRWDLALGQKWVEQSWLANVEDIFWLTLDEIESALIAEDATGLTLPALVQARKATYQEYAQTPLPFNLKEADIFSIQLGQGLAPEASPAVMVGLPISPGQVRGRIVVLHSPDDFKPDGDDAILVMPTTDPAWLPLLHRAAGLIVEMGGLLSHGSVIAREYGVPGVANIPDATRHFQTGELVLLDGSTGVVQRLE